VPISEAPQHLVAQLAARLTEEAEARIAEVRAGHEVILTKTATDAAEQAREIRSLSDELQRVAIQLREEREAHAATNAAHQAAQAQVITLTERATGLTAQVLAHEDHARSLEEKHQQAREALEHFRRSTKEQRDQELQRHEHQIQTLQVELRQTQDLLASKNQELLQLNRDNGRLLEQASQAEKALRSLQLEHQAAVAVAKEVPALHQENEGLRHRHAELAAERDTLQSLLDRREIEWRAERDAWQEGQGERKQQLERLQAIEAMLAQLKPEQAATQGTLAI